MASDRASNMASLYKYTGELSKCDDTQLVQITLCEVSARVTSGLGTFATICDKHLPKVADVYMVLATPAFRKSIKQCLRVDRVDWQTKFQMRKPDQLLLCTRKVAGKPDRCADGMLTLQIMRTDDNVAVVTAHICGKYSAPLDTP